MPKSIPKVSIVGGHAGNTHVYDEEGKEIPFVTHISWDCQIGSSFVDITTKRRVDSININVEDNSYFERTMLNNRILELEEELGRLKK